MQKVLSGEIVVELKRREFRKKIAKALCWIFPTVLIVGVIVAMVISVISKMSREEDALESVVQDVAMVYLSDGVNGVRVRCGVWPLMEANDLNYRCRISGAKITVEQFVVSARGPIVLRKKDIFRRSHLEVNQKEASVL